MCNELFLDKTTVILKKRMSCCRCLSHYCLTQWALFPKLRAGHNFTIAQLTFWFHIPGLVAPGSTYWDVACGREKGEASNDEEDMKTAGTFGKNMAFVMKKLRS